MSGNSAGRRGMTEEQRALLVRLITEQPELTDSQVSKQVGVSRAAVWKARKAKPVIKPAETTEQESVEVELERLIALNLPPERLVREAELLLSDSKTPKSVKAGLLRMIAEWGGVVTRKEKRDSEANAVLPGAVFIFQPGMVPSAAPVTPQVVVDVQPRALPASVNQADQDKTTT